MTTPAAPNRRPLKVGIQLPEVEREVRWPEYLSIAKTAEDVGFDSVWIGDHLLYRTPRLGTRGPWEVWTMLSAIAASTTRVELGPLVACTSFHNPAMLAKMANSVDEISGGRLILGLGAGWNEIEYRAFGFPFDRRVSRFEEAFTIVRTLLREGQIDFDGEFYKLRNCELLPRPARPGGPPLMIGSNGERMLQIALPHVDLWNSWFNAFQNSPDGVPELRDRVDEACLGVGRDPSTLGRTLAVLVRLPDGRGRPQGDYTNEGIAPVEGSSEEIASVLRRFADAGVAHVQLVLDPITVESVEALAPVLSVLDA